MPRVTFVKAARKDNPVCKQGESYYWWKFRFGGKRYSLTRPKPSQLTQSEYFGTLYGLCEYIGDYHVEPGQEDAVVDLRDDVTSQLEELRDEQEEKRSNMPEGLQDSPTGELLQERYEALDSAIGEIEQIEDPEQWDTVRELQDERDSWIDAEPVREDFDQSDDGTKEYDAAREEWADDEPEEVDDFEEFDASEMTDAIDQAIV
jgi:hypothetical protein